ncbi:polysaccharide deacetylase family protein [Streptomyces sp. DSM 40750]|uniref:polysaccharide deacetylase family protein n=1 Tax=Streptomyces sp. DSM 40750 TaxID=2801030 RepID=UPI00214B0667|nr:polysaccharide deacetylase family protein [Streptomyces sp. DSM 40750]UUU26843.1 polysaccharide deacetylase family protein [Streptomyces sp. DSM 40750]
MDGDAVAPVAVTPSVKSSEWLGHPPDARLLIVNCDDFGMYPAINTAVVESIEQGIASSCSLMVPCPAATDAMRLLARRPGIPFGIHLTLVRDSARYRWGPVTARAKVPSLLDETGELFVPTPAGRTALLGQARPDEVELEFRAQIDAVADAGLAPTHLDFHCLADGGRDDILDLTVGLAAEYGLAARVWLEPGRRAMRQRGLPVVDNDFLDSFSLGTEGKATQYRRLLRELPTGLNEWAVHPGLGDPDSRAVDDGWLVRRTDYEFLTSPQAHEALNQEGIVVIDYRTVQEAWARVSGECRR